MTPASGEQPLCFVDQTNHDMRIGYYTDTYRRTDEGWRLRTRSMTFLRRSGARDAGRAHDPTRPAPTARVMELDEFRPSLDRWLDEHHDALAPAHRGLGTLDEQMTQLSKVKRLTYDAGLDALGLAASGSAGSAARRCSAPTSARPSPARDLVEPGIYSMTEVLAPTMIDYAAPELAATMVPRLLRGDETWCQGFSEPGTGSNLASLSCRATRTDDGWRVTGQKVWTSLAQYAQRCVLLTRTGSPESAHRGITALFVDMDTPGHHRAAHRDHARRPRVLRGLLRRRRRASRPHPRPGGPGLGRRHGPAPLRAQHRAVAPRRVPAPAAPAAPRRRPRRRTGPGTPRRGRPSSSSRSEPAPVPPSTGWPTASASGPRHPSTRCCSQPPNRPCSTSSLDGLAGEVTIGDDPASARWRSDYLYSRAATIYGGSAEIQRNIIARRLLDLGTDR